MKRFSLPYLAIALIAIVALLLLSPNNSLAQIIVNPNFDAAPAEQTTTYLSDDPLGRAPIPAPAEQALSNLEIPESAERSDAPQSDNPTAPSGIIPPEVKISNPEAQASSAEEPQAIGIEGNTINAYVPLIIPVADFRSDGFKPNSTFFSFSGGYQQGNAEAYGCMMAPVYLPDGATVEQLYISVVDNDSSNVTVTLYRVDVYTGLTDIMGAVTSSGASSSLVSLGDTTIDYPTVDYPTYAYYVTTCISSANIKLYSVRIWYQ